MDAETVLQTDEFWKRWVAAQHAMQSGVMFEIETGRGSAGGTTPKLLRVGVNTTLTDHASLVKLLIAKGVITDLEYAQACCDGMEAEVRRYEERNGIEFA
jgi:hypothetical protein